MDNSPGYLLNNMVLSCSFIRKKLFISIFSTNHFICKELSEVMFEFNFILSLCSEIYCDTSFYIFLLKFVKALLNLYPENFPPFAYLVFPVVEETKSVPEISLPIVFKSSVATSPSKFYTPAPFSVITLFSKKAKKASKPAGRKAYKL